MTFEEIFTHLGAKSNTRWPGGSQNLYPSSGLLVVYSVSGKSYRHFKPHTCFWCQVLIGRRKWQP